MNKAVFKFTFNTESGPVEGIFVEETEMINMLKEHKPEVYKIHDDLEFVGTIDEKEIQMITTDPTVIMFLEAHDMKSGIDIMSAEVLNPGIPTGTLLKDFLKQKIIQNKTIKTITR